MRKRTLGVSVLLMVAVAALLTACDKESTPVATGPTPSASATGTWVPSPSLVGQLQDARLATGKYATDLKQAEADGYMIITKMMPGMGFHYLNPNIKSFDATKPMILVYEQHGNAWQLAALEWVFPEAPATPPLEGATYGAFDAACHYKDGTFVPKAAESDCAKTAPDTGSPFNFWHPNLVTMHAWVWYDNPAGLYHGTNPLVEGFTA
jgi:hypothetical protein